jgi:GMP synthase (glutamine-hydrolysing)
MPTLVRYADDLRTLHADPSRKDLAWLYGLSDDVLEPANRRSELKQWVEWQVIKK